MYKCTVTPLLLVAISVTNLNMNRIEGNIFSVSASFKNKLLNENKK